MKNAQTNETASNRKGLVSQLHRRKAMGWKVGLPPNVVQVAGRRFTRNTPGLTRSTKPDASHPALRDPGTQNRKHMNVAEVKDAALIELESERRNLALNQSSRDPAHTTEEFQEYTCAAGAGGSQRIQRFKVCSNRS